MKCVCYESTRKKRKKLESKKVDLVEVLTGREVLKEGLIKKLTE